MARIEKFEPGLEEKILECWNNILEKDPITMEVFERKILLDPNFVNDGFLIARENDKIAGFIINIYSRYPLFYQKIEKNAGWITVLAFKNDKEGLSIGRELLDKSLEWFRKNDKNVIYFSNYIPNYFTPGIDAEAYPQIYKILIEFGFEEIHEALAMDTSLWPKLTYPDNIESIVQRLRNEGIKFSFMKTKYLRPFIDFLEKNMPADWYRHALELLKRNRKNQIIIAVKGNEVVGYCQFWNGEGYDWYSKGAHFGPFGVREDFRGKGIGTVLLYKCLAEMKKNGIHNAFVLWTDERAGRLYSRFGFNVTRRFKVMKKVL